MNIDRLEPAVTHWELFSPDKAKFVPSSSGCYVLTTFDGTVLYVGLAINLRRRFDQHLDSPDKRNETTHGKAIKFHWVEVTETNRVERTWLNIHVHHEGRYPVLNKVYSPT